MFKFLYRALVGDARQAVTDKRRHELVEARDEVLDDLEDVQAYRDWHLEMANEHGFEAMKLRKELRKAEAELAAYDGISTSGPLPAGGK